jgi:hypothetical protein
MIEQFNEKTIDRLLKQYPPKILSPEEKVQARALREKRSPRRSVRGFREFGSARFPSVTEM